MLALHEFSLGAIGDPRILQVASPTVSAPYGMINIEGAIQPSAPEPVGGETDDSGPGNTKHIAE